jgi:hypothetical protein
MADTWYLLRPGAVPGPPTLAAPPKGSREAQLCWFAGRPLPLDLATPLRYDQQVLGGGRPGPVPDWVPTVTAQCLVSARAAALLQPFATCLRAYPATLWYQDRQRTADLVALNFERAWPALDRRRSHYTVLAADDLRPLYGWDGSWRSRVAAWWQRRHAGPRVELISRLVLDLAQVPPGERLFRLAEYPVLLLAHEQVRAAVTAAELTGFAWEETAI